MSMESEVIQMRPIKMITSCLALVIAVAFVVKYRKVIRGAAKDIVEKGKTKVVEGFTWMREAK